MTVVCSDSVSSVSVKTNALSLSPVREFVRSVPWVCVSRCNAGVLECSRQGSLSLPTREGIKKRQFECIARAYTHALSLSSPLFPLRDRRGWIGENSTLQCQAPVAQSAFCSFRLKMFVIRFDSQVFSKFCHFLFDLNIILVSTITQIREFSFYTSDLSFVTTSFLLVPSTIVTVRHEKRISCDRSPLSISHVSI